MRILYCASEANPFCGSGGTADRVSAQAIRGVAARKGASGHGATGTGYKA